MKGDPSQGKPGARQLTAACSAMSNSPAPHQALGRHSHHLPILERRKLRHRKAKQLAQGIVAGNQFKIQAVWCHSGFSATCHTIPGFILILFLRGASEPRTEEPQSGSQGPEVAFLSMSSSPGKSRRCCFSTQGKTLGDPSIFSGCPQSSPVNSAGRGSVFS